MIWARVTFCAAIVMGLISLLAVSPASAHIRDGKNRWMFTGSSYKANTSLDRDNVADPINLLFRGGSSLDSGAVRSHIESDWDKRRIPSDVAKRVPNAGEMKNRPGGINQNALCRGVQDVYIRDAQWRGHADSPRQYMSSNGVCGNQYHIRLWSDRLHSQYFGHSLDWVIGNIHHDKVIKKCKVSIRKCVAPYPAHGPPDMPWDLSRYVGYKAMGKHCTYPHFATHAGAEGMHGKYWSSGIITRISMRHTSSGCVGA